MNLRAFALLAVFSVFPVLAFGADVEITGNVTPSPASSPTWNISDQLVVGLTGNGTLAISGNGSVSNTSAIIANGAASVSSVSVTGGSWTNSSIIAVGNSGNGTLEISGNGSVFATTTALAVNPGSTGTLRVTTGGTLTASQLSEGSGNGTVSFDGGTLRLTGNQANLFAGFEAGDVTLSGAGTIDTQGFNVASSLGLAGGGELNKQGSGTLTLTGNNTYTGRTNVRGGTLALTGTGAINTPTVFHVGVSAGETGTFALSGNAVVNVSASRLGWVAGSTGTANVTGGTWTSSTHFWVGEFGNGTLNLSNGTISNAIGFIAALPGSTGTANVSGGSWLNTADIGLGNGGHGTLNLSGDGLVSSRSVIVAGTPSTTGILNLNGGTLRTGQVGEGSGTGTVTFNGGTLQLTGNQSALFSGFEVGDVTLTGTGNNTIDTQSFTVATSLGLTGTGSLTKQGTGTLTLTGNNTYSGNTIVNDGTLDLSAGGAITNTAGIIANDVSSNGQVTVTDGTWTNSSFIAVGNSGNGTLQISGTSNVTSSTTAVAVGAGSTGSLQLLGGALTASQVSEGSGNGTVIFNGGTLRLSGNQSALFNGFENGDVTFTGPGGATIDTQNFNVATGVGIVGNSSLTKQGSGTLTLTGNSTFSGGASIRNGTLTLDGGSLNHPGAGIFVGQNSGENAALISNNGTISTNLISAGHNSGSAGNFTMNGGTLNNSFETWIGNAGTGNSTFTAGTINNTIGNIARLGGSRGHVTMSGGTWNNSQSFVVGNQGNGTFILSGGTVNTAFTTIGRQAGGTGNATITGGTWNTTGNFVVGEGGAGVVNFNGGVVTAAQFLRGSATGRINLNGGTVRLSGNQTNLFNGFQPGDITLLGAGGTIDTQGFSVATSTVISGTGPLAKIGHGTLTLSGNQTYTGATNVQTGKLIVDGSLASNVAVANNATFAPGTNVSTTVINGLTLHDFSYFDFQLSTPGIVGSGTNDLLQINGNLVLGGLLNIEALTGFGAGDYRLMNYTGTLTNNQLLFGNVPGGFEYFVNTGTANQVNLGVTAATAQYWDGPNSTPQGVPLGSGGNGTWSIRSTNWTNAGGNANSNSLGTLTSVFGGTSGTVTIADGFNARATALTFQTDGYEITSAGNGTLELMGAGLVDTQATAATISAPIGGNSTLTKQGTGALTLSADNTILNGVFVRDGSILLTSTGAIRTFPLTVGLNSGDHATLVNNGGFISSRLGTLGESAGSVGNATISSGTWNNTSEFRVGNAGTGHLTISGGTINNFATPNTGDDILNVGRLAGSNGTVTMTGGTINVFEVNIGNAGEGTLVMSGGTINSFTRAYIGRQGAGLGLAQLSGNATWNHRFDFLVGGGATGTLEISDDAKLNIINRWLSVGGGVFGTSAGNGTVLMTGGSIATLGLRIGEKGTGVFTLSNGTISPSAASGTSLIGSSGGTGTMNMTGGTWTGGSPIAGILIGNGGGSTGTLDLSGGTINNTIAHVGAGGGTGIANVSGGTWNNSGEFRVGDGSGGNGILNLTGGTITGALGNIGREGGSQGMVQASGGTWSNTSQLIIGNAGNGNVTISGTAEVSSSETIVGRQASGVGALILAGGRLTSGDIREELGNGTVTFDGGLLRLSGNQANLFGGFETGEVTIASGGATIDTQNFAVSSAADIGGNGSLTKLGAGSLTLGGNNTFTGPTDITAGGLTVNGALATSSLTMGNGTSLSGNGSIAGEVLLSSNVTINPGDGLGTLTLGDLGLNATTILNFGLGTPALSDRIVVNGDLTLAGTLNIANLSGFGLGTYRLFDYTGSLTDNGLLFGITPGFFDLTLSTATPNEVNLIVSAAAAQYWDGPNTTPQGVPGGTGGNGTWDAASTNWTDVTGTTNAAWDEASGAAFSGAPGTVTIADGFQPKANSLAFQTDGYLLSANGTGAVEMTGGARIFVGPGQTTISAPLIGTAPTVVKEGEGQLELVGTNTYTGATWVRDGLLMLTGNGSISHSASDFAVARYFGDEASFLLSGNASLTNRTGFLGVDPGSTGNATVEGGNWTNTDELRVGDLGRGHLTIQGGNITSTIGNIARSVGSNGSVTMSGGSWINSSLFVVGNQGTGSLNFSGGNIESVTSSIGLNAGGVGLATMTNGTWTNSGELRVGDSGRGTFAIQGGNITSTIGNIARNGGSQGLVTMSGGTWNATDLFVVGNTGVGNFTQSGGSVTTLEGEIGRNPGGLGVANLSGGIWTNSNSLIVGKFGHGALNLLAGGNVDVSGGNLTIAAQAGSVGTLNIGSPDLANPTAAGTLLTNGIIFGAGSGTIQFNQTDTFSTNATISGPGSLTQRGNGTTVLAATNSYTGPTNLENGSLIVGADNALGTGLLTISAGTTLGALGSGNYQLENEVEVQGYFALEIGDTANLEFTGPVSLGEESRTLTLLDSGTLCFSGALSGNGGLTLLTLGATPTVSFCGPNDNTFTGPLTVGSDVTVGLEKDPGKIAVAGDFTLEAGGSALMLGGLDQIATTSNVTIYGRLGFLNLFGSNTATFASLIGNSTGLIENVGSAMTLALGGGYFAGIIDDTSADEITLQKFGPNTLTLTGNNTFSGGVEITGGTLVAENQTALGNGTVSLEAGSLSLTTAVTTGGLEWSGGALSMTLGTTLTDLQLTGDLAVSGAGGNFNFVAGAGFALSQWYSLIDVGGSFGASVANFFGNNLAGGVPRFALNGSTLEVFFLPTVQVVYGANNRNLTLSTPITNGRDDIVQLVKVGTKNLTLTANNTYTGNTIISNGTLTLGTRRKVSGSILGNVENEGTLAFRRKDPYTFGGTITGNGVVQLQGRGALTLEGNNAYSGGTILRQGTLNIGHASALGTGALTFAGRVSINNTTGGALTLLGDLPQFWNSNFTFLGQDNLDLGRGAVLLKGSRTVTVAAGQLTVGGTIAGTRPNHGLGKAGAGTLLLTANNTYTGRTTIRAGTLALGDGGTSGWIASTQVTNNGILAFNRSDDVEFSANIAGRGRLDQNGNGTLLLSGKNSYKGNTSLNRGTLLVGSDQALGRSSVVLTQGLLGAVEEQQTIQVGGSLLWDADARIQLTLNSDATLSQFVNVRGGISRLGTGTLVFDLQAAVAPTASVLLLSVRGGINDLLVSDFAFISSNPGLTGSLRLESNNLFYDPPMTMLSRGPSLDFAAIPEPGVSTLLLLALALLGWRRRWRSA